MRDDLGQRAQDLAAAELMWDLIEQLALLDHLCASQGNRSRPRTAAGECDQCEDEDIDTKHKHDEG